MTSAYRWAAQPSVMQHGTHIRVACCTHTHTHTHTRTLQGMAQGNRRCFQAGLVQLADDQG